MVVAGRVVMGAGVTVHVLMAVAFRMVMSAGVTVRMVVVVVVRAARAGVAGRCISFVLGALGLGHRNLLNGLTMYSKHPEATTGSTLRREKSMKIGELAKAARCTPETIRFYEKEGLMPDAERTDANYRNYTETHVERLRFIRNCRALDMTHDEIRALLRLTDTPTDRCDSVNALLDAHIGHVDARLAELTHLRGQLTALREQCVGEHSVGDCGIVHGLATMETVAPAAKRTHVG